MQQAPAFLQIPSEELVTWRSSHPVSEMILEWMAWEADQSNYKCAALLRNGEKDKATAMAGEASAWEKAIALLTRKDPVKQEEEKETFIEPAYRFNPEMAPAEETDAGTE